MLLISLFFAFFIVNCSKAGLAMRFLIPAKKAIRHQVQKFRYFWKIFLLDERLLQVTILCQTY